MDIAHARKHALSLPEAIEAPHHESASFRVRGKIFASVPPVGGLLHVFVDDLTRDAACAAMPDAFENLYWGKKIAGLRIRLAAAPEADVRRLLTCAWRHKAPKALVASEPGASATPVTDGPAGS